MTRDFHNLDFRYLVIVPLFFLVGLFIVHQYQAGPPSAPASINAWVEGMTGLAMASPTLTPAAPQKSATEDRYEQALKKGRELTKVCRRISLNFFDGTRAQSRKWKEQWPDAAKALSDHQPVLEQAAVEWFFECKKPSNELLELATGISVQAYDAGDFELSWDILQKIKKFHPDADDIMLERRMSMLAIKTNRFDFAMDFLRKPDAQMAVEKMEVQLDKNMFLMCPLLAHNWTREKELRDKEAEADDLPRVKLQLSTGEVVVELYENEAPETVANFINLVESGYYDDAIFHPVIKSIVAQTGLINRSHNTPLGYAIKNESRVPDVRKHYIGTLTVANGSGEDNLLPGRFAITLLPNPDLDWDGTDEDTNAQTAFGRVISGLKHVAALPVTMEIDPETEEQKTLKVGKPGLIEKATVIRKREHDYKFEKIRSDEEE